MAKSKFIGKTVWLKTIDSEYSFKAKILLVYEEAGSMAYMIQHENGDKEPIFVDTVSRLYPVNQRKAPVIPMRRKLKLVK